MEKLKNYLSRKGLPPSHFADEIGVARSTILRILRGDYSPSLRVMQLIAEATGNRVKLTDW